MIPIQTNLKKRKKTKMKSPTSWSTIAVPAWQIPSRGTAHEKVLCTIGIQILQKNKSIRYYFTCSLLSRLNDNVWNFRTYWSCLREGICCISWFISRSILHQEQCSQPTQTTSELRPNVSWLRYQSPHVFHFKFSVSYQLHYERIGKS